MVKGAEPRKPGVSVGFAVALAVGFTVLTGAVVSLLRSQGWHLPDASWVTALLIALVAAAVWASVWPIRRQLRSGASRVDNPLRAARVVALTQAALATGAVLVGWYAGQAASWLPDVDAPSVQERIWVLGVTALASALLAFVGWWGQESCRVDSTPEHDDA